MREFTIVAKGKSVVCIIVTKTFKRNDHNPGRNHVGIPNSLFIYVAM